MSFVSLLVMVYILWGNPVQDYAIAIAVVAVSSAILRFIVSEVKKGIVKHKSVPNEVKQILSHLGGTFYLLLPLYIGTLFLETAGTFGKIVDYGLLFVIIYYAAKIASIAMEFGLERYAAQKKEEDKDFDRSFLNMIRMVGKMIVWIIAILLFISNIGIQITPLIAGLGVGGIAIAFALQNILADIFAYFSIQFDKPFRAGDFIIIGADMGTIKRIGLRSTRVQALSGQEIIVSNKELTSVRVNNYKKMEERRVDFPFGVEYGTSSKKLEQIPKIVKDIINNNKKIRFGRCHFKSFGAYSLDFETVYFIPTNDYDIYMDVQQEINLKIKKAFEKARISMAFPTQTIILEKN